MTENEKEQEKKSRDKTFALENDLWDPMEADAKTRDVNVTVWLNKAVEHFLRCEKNGIGGMIPKILNWDDHCKKCGNKVEAGNWALWGRGIGVICIDCYIQQLGDKGLIAKYLKTREYGEVLGALKKECATYANKVEIYQLQDKQAKLIELQEKMANLIIDYLQNKVGTDKSVEGLDQILTQREQSERIMHDIETFLKRKLDARKKWAEITKQTE